MSTKPNTTPVNDQGSPASENMEAYGDLQIAIAWSVDLEASVHIGSVGTIIASSETVSQLNRLRNDPTYAGSVTVFWNKTESK